MKHCKFKLQTPLISFLKIIQIVCIYFSLFDVVVHAQITFMSCPNDSLSPYPDSIYNPSPCIDVDEILAELEGGDQCRLIWINMNVHFFVDNDSLTKLITPSGHTTIEANSLAEELIDNANYIHYLNETQLNQSGAVKLCNPFQYVLRGVYIHIVSSPNNVDALYQLKNMYDTYGINKTSEFNLFISPCDGCSGVAGGIGGSITYLNLAFPGGNVLNHEWGHTMGLGHSWLEDGISDTPEINFDVDRNCDGDLSDNREKKQQCFGKIAVGDSLNSATDQIGTSWNSNDGRWYDSLNDCKEVPPCPTSKCCLDEYQNNNVMAYNACQCSFTYLQIKKVLMQLLSYKCDYINTIVTDRHCHAPNAFISLPLPGISNYGYCSTTFDFSASFNDSRYKVKIYEITGGGPVLSYESAWINGPATQMTFKNYGISVGSGRYLKPGTNYRIELIVEYINAECSLSPAPSSNFDRNFTTGTCEPDPYNPPITFTEMLIAPNPATTTTELTFDAFEGEEFGIFAVHHGNSQISLLCNSMYATSEGENEYEVSVNSLSSGTYTIFMIGIDHNYYNTLVKP